MTHSSDAPAAVDYSIRWIVGASCAFAVVLLLGTIAIGKVKLAHILSGKHHLEIQLTQTEQTLQYWITSQLSTLERFAHLPQVVELAEAQRQRYEKGLPLMGDELAAMRELFNQQEAVLGYNGFFVILPNGISIASMRDNNIGTRNLISIYKTQLFNAAAEGKPVFIPPIPSDVPIAGQKQIAGKHEHTSAFFLTPIRNRADQVIALLSRRVNPDKDFSELLNPPSSQFIYNVFAFDRYGYLLSTPNNVDSLVKQGFLRLNETPTLGIRLTAFQSFDNPREFAERNEILPLNSAIKTLVDNPDIQTLMSPIPYKDLTGTPVYGAWRWSEALGIGLAVEQNQDSVLANFAATCHLLIGLIVTTSLFIFYITFAALKSHHSLNRSHQHLAPFNSQESEDKIQTLNQQLQHQELELNSERDYWNTLEKSVALVVINDRGTVIQSSTAFRQLTALTEKAIKENGLNLLAEAELSEYNRNELLTALTRRASWHGELKLKLLQGQTLYLRTTVTPLRNRKDGQTQFMATLLDYSSPRGYAASLKYRLDQLTKALEPSDIGFWRLNIPLGRLMWDDKMFTLYRTSERGHIESLNYWWQLIETTDRERVVKTLERAIESRSPFCTTFQTSGLIEDGSMVIAGSVESDAHGNAAEVIGLSYQLAVAPKDLASDVAT